MGGSLGNAVGMVNPKQLLEHLHKWSDSHSASPTERASLPLSCGVRCIRRRSRRAAFKRAVWCSRPMLTECGSSSIRSRWRAARHPSHHHTLRVAAAVIPMGQHAWQHAWLRRQWWQRRQQRRQQRPQSSQRQPEAGRGSKNATERARRHRRRIHVDLSNCLAVSTSTSRSSCSSRIPNSNVHSNSKGIVLSYSYAPRADAVRSTKRAGAGKLSFMRRSSPTS